MNYKSALAQVIGITDGIVVPFGFKFACSQEAYTKNLVDWLFTLEDHTKKQMIASWSGSWKDGFCTINFAEVQENL